MQGPTCVPTVQSSVAWFHTLQVGRSAVVNLYGRMFVKGLERLPRTFSLRPLGARVSWGFAKAGAHHSWHGSPLLGPRLAVKPQSTRPERAKAMSMVFAEVRVEGGSAVVSQPADKAHRRTDHGNRWAASDSRRQRLSRTGGAFIFMPFKKAGSSG